MVHLLPLQSLRFVTSGEGNSAALLKQILCISSRLPERLTKRREYTHTVRHVARCGRLRGKLLPQPVLDCLKHLHTLHRLRTELVHDPDQFRPKLRASNVNPTTAA